MVSLLDNFRWDMPGRREPLDIRADAWYHEKFEILLQFALAYQHSLPAHDAHFDAANRRMMTRNWRELQVSLAYCAAMDMP